MDVQGKTVQKNYISACVQVGKVLVLVYKWQYMELKRQIILSSHTAASYIKIKASGFPQIMETNILGKRKQVTL